MPSSRNYHPLRGTLNLIAILLVIAIGLLAYNTFGPQGANAQYEYRIEYFKDSSTESGLETLGREGWEVVSARRASSSYSDDYGYEFILKKNR